MSNTPGKSYSKYKVNHNIFQEETERAFYLAGFIAADGCIRIAKTNKTRNYINHRLQISLSKNDKDHLVLIRDLLESTHPVRDYLIKNSEKNDKWNDVWESKLMITSKQIVSDLRRFNIVPRKSLIYTFPIWLKSHPLLNHFMRGYFDGDGTVYFPKNSDHIVFGVRGTMKFLNIYKQMLKRKCKIDTDAIPSVQNGIGNFRIQSNTMVAEVAKFLYKNATIFLPRKYEIISDRSAL
jgi:intein/homing endonuclease